MKLQDIVISIAFFLFIAMVASVVMSYKDCVKYRVSLGESAKYARNYCARD